MSVIPYKDFGHIIIKADTKSVLTNVSSSNFDGLSLAYLTKIDCLPSLAVNSLLAFKCCGFLPIGVFIASFSHKHCTALTFLVHGQSDHPFCQGKPLYVCTKFFENYLLYFNMASSNIE